MSYIRGALPNLIYNPNTRDDLLPDGLTSTFELSQEVPGGYEGNVQVTRREFKSDELIQSSTSSFTFNAGLSTISSANSAVAAALSVLNIGEIIEISGATNPSNNDEFLITSIVYDGASISIEVIGVLVNETSSSITAVRKFAGPWEVLEPIVDYTISGTGPQYNKLINLSKTPIEQDVIYVLHRGEATFNFVPTQKTVGPDQLQDNLRNFVVDIFTGDGATTDFTLSQLAVSPRSIEVSVSGSVKYGDDTDLAFVGDFELIEPAGEIISFHSAPANLSKIYVRHLGFTTVSRRQTLTPSQVGSIAPGSVGILELANGAVIEPKLADLSVSTSKIQANSVTGAKILLDNNQYLNAKDSLNVAQGIIKLDASNKIAIRSVGGTLSLNISDARLIQFSTNLIADGTGTGFIDLGSSANKFKDLNLSGAANVASVVASGNVGAATVSTSGDATVGGNLTVTGGQVNTVNIAALQAQVSALAVLVATNTPSGSIRIWPSAAAPTGWFLCDGTAYSTTTYAALFAQIGYSYGGVGASFNVPDFRGRFPLGKSTAGTGSTLGGTGGSLDHTHSTPAHTHGLANHVHAIAGHYHTQNTGIGSTLSITSSGTHTTQLDHIHAATSTGFPGGGLLSGADEGAHTHSISDPGHVHDQFVTAGTGGNDGLVARFDYDADYISGQRNKFPQGATTGSKTTGITVNSGGAHQHYVQVPGFSGPSLSDGAHIHAASTLSGSIGKVTGGLDGNAGFSSGTPSPNLTDSDGAGTTSGTNPAFISTNFIIKY